MDHPPRDLLSAIARDVIAGFDPRKSIARHGSEFPNPSRLLEELRAHVEREATPDARRKIAESLAKSFPNTFVSLDFYCETFKRELKKSSLIRLRSRAASLQPKSKIATVRLAEALESDGQMLAALEVMRAAIRSGLSDEILSFKAGYYANLSGDHSQALEFYKKALKAEVHHRTLLNMASAARHIGDFELSEASSKRAILLRPDIWDAYYNLGNLRREIGNVQDAVRQSARAEKLKPESASVKWNLSHALMASGDFAKGFKVYRDRWFFDGFPTRIRYPGISNVDSVKGLTGSLFVYCEQGVGDNLLFARFIPKLLEQLPEGVTATFECYQSVLNLLQNSFPQAKIVPYDKTLREGYDFYLPLFDVPALLGIADVSGQAFPYIVPSPRPELPTISSSRPKVGIVWAGNPKFTHDQQRSAKIDDIDGLFEGLNADFYCFQKGRDEGVISERHPDVVDLAPHLTDFEATAVLMQQMDVVVSTCTSTANLAGALGKKGIVLTGPARDWRWMTGRTSDWFPSLTILQRSRTQSWESFFVDARHELARILEHI